VISICLSGPYACHLYSIFSCPHPSSYLTAQERKKRIEEKQKLREQEKSAT
jgi:uracil-DNA glycosylase